jgi:hypothetical protein
MAKDHPYREFENLAAWPIIEQAIGKLVRNKDLIEQTDRRYIVGFVVKALSDNGLLIKQAKDAKTERTGF